MLSQEIYDSWNAKTLRELDGFLRNIEGPHIPNNVRSSAFKTVVLKKIEKRRAKERRRSRDGEFDFLNYNESAGRGCCSCIKKRHQASLPINLECTSLYLFEAMCETSKQRFGKTISSVKALIQKLSYWDSIKPGTDGLSVIGGYIWLLSFTCQHLIDSPGHKDEFRMQKHITEVKDLYQFLAQAGEVFHDMAASFHEKAYNMRMDGLLVLKKLTKRWKVPDDHNPLLIRTELIRNIPRPRKRLGNGLDCPVDTEDDDDVFSVKWSPLAVYIQLNRNAKFKPFGKLHPQDRVTIFNKFLKYTLNAVEMAAEDLTVISHGLHNIELHGVEGSPVHSGRDITAAMLDFSKSKMCPKSLENEKEKKRFVILLNEFWYSLDVLYENIFVVLRLVEETRDIIRMCYVYTDIFYKWRMPSYDSFISKNQYHRKSDRSSVVGSAKDILSKFGSGDKKLSETVSILTLMDFSSSIYQGVVQEIPIHCEQMVLSLKQNESDWEEPHGLVSGIIDKRKSSVAVTSKHTQFK